MARFDADGSGRWLPLVHGQGPLTAANGFADQGEVVIKARQASDLLGATKMDRPEWLAIDPTARRGLLHAHQQQQPRRARTCPASDAANPRANNVMGQIIRWKEDGDFDAHHASRWNHLVLAGDPANERPEARGNIQGDLFACPDGLTLDARGVLWIQTDMPPRAMYKGELDAHRQQPDAGRATARTGEVRRFLTGPVELRDHRRAR